MRVVDEGNEVAAGNSITHSLTQTGHSINDDSAGGGRVIGHQGGGSDVTSVAA